ncbi:MAG: ferritin family protein [Chloroflexota bacterium]
MAEGYMDAVDALKIAIERERGANRFYRQAADTTENADGKAVFKWLAKEELRHLAKLRQQLKSVLGANKWLEWRRVATPIERTELPRLSEAAGSVKVDAAAQNALRRAIEAEQKSIAFYEKAADITIAPNGKAMFQALSREEKGHLALVEEELEWLIKARQYFTIHRFTLRSR